VGLPTVSRPSARSGLPEGWYRSLPLLAAAWPAGLATVWAWADDADRRAPVGFIDLRVYRLGLSVWSHGGDLYGRLPATTAGHLPYVYPPFSVLLLGPLDLVSWRQAIVVTLVVSLVCLGVVLYLTFLRVWPGAGRRGALLATAVLLPAALLLEPVRGDLWFGQVNIALMGLVLVDCLVISPRWPRGVLIGIAAAVKLTPAVFLLYFLLRKDFRAAMWMTATAMAATAVGFVVSWSGSLRYWFGSGGARSISGSTYATNQTIDGLLARWGLPDPPRTALWLFCSALLVVVAAAGIRRATRLGDTALAVVITADLGLVVSPTSWSYHWVYVAPAVLVLAGRAWRRRGTRNGLGWAAACLVVAVVFWDAPFHTLPSHHDRELQWTLWQQVPGNSYLLLGVALLVVFAAPDLPPLIRAVRGRAAALVGFAAFETQDGPRKR
jgi:alpha-1,2-mannosyltransferase